MRREKNTILGMGARIVSILMILGFALAMQSCEEDAPEFAHSLGELEGDWQWNTEEGDAAEYFGVSIRQISESEISIVNFHNTAGDELSASVSGSQLSFEGELVDGNIVISNGKGTITNGWLTITLEYDCTSDGETEHTKVQLNKGKVLSKSALVCTKEQKML
ncbi:MAG: hypothetical protein MJZ66_05395 [Bacteroidales bacterium]|nr:hypothetical protein [Bacteroidales bacterium]